MVFAASSSTSAQSREAHLARLAPRRRDAEDRFVDEVATLLRIREHLLEHAQGELSLARCALREICDVILDRSRADLIERDGTEHVEVLHQVARAVERGRANAERVAVEPAGGELAERLGRRLVERAK